MEILHSHRTPSGKVYYEFAIKESEKSLLDAIPDAADGSTYKISKTGEIGNYVEEDNEWIPLLNIKEE